MQNRQRFPSLLSKSLLAGLILFCLAAASGSPIDQDRGQGTQPSRPGASERYFALLIAVQDYAKPAIQSLDFPLADADKVQRILTSSYTFDPQHITLLKNPDRNTILNTLDQLAEQLKPEDSLLIFYAGHGYWDEARKQGYWWPRDAQRNLRADWISNSDLRDVIRAIPARHTLLISDACFSGSLFVTRGAEASRPTAIEELSRLLSRTAMTSGALTTVPDRSVFVEYLVKRLSENREPYLPAFDLFGQMRTPVINNSPRQPDGNIPTPRYGVIQEAADEGGDFIFVRRETAPAPPTRPTPTQVVSAEQQAWEHVKHRRTLDAVRGYLNVYPDSPFEKEARTLLAVLEKEKPPISSNPPPVSTSAASVSAALTPIIPLPRGVAPTALSVYRFTTASVDTRGKVTKFDGTPTQQYSEDLENGVQLEMVAIKGGTFMMGTEYGERDERPVRHVTISNFWIGKFEVTQTQWRAVMGNNPSKFKVDNLPVENVSWKDAKEFCRKLNAKLGLNEAEGYRLPTEAEWEYAARADSQNEFAFGDTLTPDIVNYNGNFPYRDAPKGAYQGRPLEVGRLGIANSWGLFDMLGNVWEWCEDRYGGYSTGAITHPSGPSSGSSHVNRGGGWRYGAIDCRLTRRGHAASGFRVDDLGFRLVRSSR